MTNLNTSSPVARLLGKVHGRAVHKRRIAVLAARLASMLAPGSKVLDVGCGDGRIGALLGDTVPHLEVQGAERLPRAGCAIPCQVFDGVHLPFADRSADCCMFVDVLHHTLDPLPILREACRVSSQFILIKDHVAEGPFDRATLRFMDWMGNAPHGVPMTYNYLSQSQWKSLYGELDLTLVRTDRAIPLYPFPFSRIFGRNLHFISLLKIRE